MTVVSITILHRRNTADIVRLETELPDPVYPFTDNLSFTFLCAKGRSECYVANHWPGVPVTIIREWNAGEVAKS